MAVHILYLHKIWFISDKSAIIVELVMDQRYAICILNIIYAVTSYFLNNINNLPNLFQQV